MPFGRRNIFREIEALFERMGHELDAREWPRGDGVGVDVADHGDRYVVRADLPGFDRDDIDVHLVKGSLRLAASRKAEEVEEDINYLRRERRRKSISRTVALPHSVDEENVQARYDSGVLTVELPKQETGGTRIDIY